MSIRKFRSLLFRHGEIHQRIEAEQQRPHPDAMRLLRLKRLRLALKDQLRKIADAMEQGDARGLVPATAGARRASGRFDF